MDFDPKLDTGLVQRTARCLYRDRPSLRASLELEDLEQELWIVCMKARAKYQKGRGASFSTYFTQAARNFASTYASRSGKRRSVVGEDPRAISEDGYLPELADESAIDPLARMECAEVIEKAFARSDSRVRRVVELLSDSSELMRREDEAVRAKAAYARSKGIGRPDDGVAMSEIFTLVGLERSWGYRLIAGFKETINELNG